MSDTAAELHLDCSWGPYSSRVHVEKPTTFGRSPDSDVKVPLEDVSRAHVRVEPTDGGWRVVDLGSHNGTYLNGDRISEPVALRDGDLIKMGGALLRVEIESPMPVGGLADGGTMVIAARPVQEMLGVDSMAHTMVGAPERKAQNWALGLASDAAEALLHDANLDEAFAALLRLAASYLPAERGLIALCDGDEEPRPHASFGYEDDEPSFSRQVARQVIRGRQAMLIEEVGAQPENLHATLVRTAVRSVAAAPLYHRDAVRGLIYVDTRNAARGFKADDLEVLAALGLFAAIGIEQKRVRDLVGEMEKVQSRLERFASPAVIERVIQTTMSGDMIAEERSVSVLFADLCGFTTLSEGMAPAEVAELLNTVFDRLTQVVFEFEGTLDKFMGDGMMAFFGAPLPQSDHAVRAAKAAWRMAETLTEINAEVDLPQAVQMRFGINSGPVIVGDIGSRKRRDYTVIGDTVNVASRLEGLADPGQVMIAEATWQDAREHFDCEPAPPVQVKGRQEPVQPYRLVGPR